jgi:hypothetical protein
MAAGIEIGSGASPMPGLGKVLGAVPGAGVFAATSRSSSPSIASEAESFRTGWQSLLASLGSSLDSKGEDLSGTVVEANRGTAFAGAAPETGSSPAAGRALIPTSSPTTRAYLHLGQGIEKSGREIGAVALSPADSRSKSLVARPTAGATKLASTRAAASTTKEEKKPATEQRTESVSSAGPSDSIRVARPETRANEALPGLVPATMASLPQIVPAPVVPNAVAPGAVVKAQSAQADLPTSLPVGLAWASQSSNSPIPKSQSEVAGRANTAAHKAARVDEISPNQELVSPVLNHSGASGQTLNVTESQNLREETPSADAMLAKPMETVTPSQNPTQKLASHQNQAQPLTHAANQAQAVVPTPSTTMTVLPEQDAPQKVVPGQNQNRRFTSSQNLPQPLTPISTPTAVIAPGSNLTAAIAPEQNATQTIAPSQSSTGRLADSQDYAQPLSPVWNSTPPVVHSSNPPAAAARERGATQTIAPSQNPAQPLAPVSTQTAVVVPSSNLSEAVEPEQSATQACAPDSTSTAPVLPSSNLTAAVAAEQSATQTVAPSQNPAQPLAPVSTQTAVVVPNSNLTEAVSQEQSTMLAGGPSSNLTAAAAAEQSATQTVAPSQSPARRLADHQDQAQPLTPSPTSAPAVAPGSTLHAAVVLEQGSTSTVAPSESPIQRLANSQSQAQPLTPVLPSTPAIAPDSNLTAAVVREQSATQMVAPSESPSPTPSRKLADSQNQALPLTPVSPSTPPIAPNSNQTAPVVPEQRATQTLAPNQSPARRLADSQNRAMPPMASTIQSETVVPRENVTQTITSSQSEVPVQAVKLDVSVVAPVLAPNDGIGSVPAVPNAIASEAAASQSVQPAAISSSVGKPGSARSDKSLIPGSTRSVRGVGNADSVQQATSHSQAQPSVPVVDATAVTRELAGAHGAPNAAGELTAGKTVTSEPDSREAFATLDAEGATARPTWIHAGAQRAEAGFQDPALGWVGVRAQTSGGGVHAELVPGSADAAQALSGHMAGLNAFLAEHHTQVDTVTLSAPESGGTGLGSDRSTGEGMQQGAGDQAGQQRSQGVESGFQPGPSGGPSAGTSQSPTRPAGLDGSIQTAELVGGHISVMA